MNFQQLVSQVMLKKVGGAEQRICPDQYVGKVSGFEADLRDFPVRRSAKSRSAQRKCLIIVLESPHIQEFAEQPAPARGSTGRQIRKWIRSVVGEEYKDYGMILVNAIQHQCSLGLPPTCVRDEVFCAAWVEGGEDDFIARLRSYYKKGDLVVNCCTKGQARQKELRKLVHQAILAADLGCEVFRKTHPSSWRFARNREHTWPWPP